VRVASLQLRQSWRRETLDPAQPLAELSNQYLSALLRYDRHSASALILRAVENKVSIKEIYSHVFERCQYEIGRLWQLNDVSVALSTIAPLPHSS
jgi:methanogenic corrinoid protein MtbC1